MSHILLALVATLFMGCRNAPVPGAEFFVSPDTTTDPIYTPSTSLIAPSNLQLDEASNDSIRINWVNGSNSGTFSTQIEYRGESDVDYTEAGMVAQNVMEFEINGLDADTTYYIRVRAIQDSFASEYASILTADTLPDAEVHTIHIYSTTATYTGNLGGRTGADNKCAMALPSSLAGYESHAMISVNTADEIRDMPVNYQVPTTMPIYGATATTGDKIADNWADLMDGSIDMTLFDAGVLASGIMYWTATNATGGTYDVQGNCSSWTSASATNNGSFGASNYVDTRWLTRQETACDDPQRLICIAY